MFKKINYKSPEWRHKRDEFLSYCESVGMMNCWRCHRKYEKGFHVHHRKYWEVGNESVYDLELLCETCHNKHHNRRTKKYTPKRVSVSKRWKIYRETGECLQVK